jgi:hypothetical protein
VPDLGERDAITFGAPEPAGGLRSPLVKRRGLVLLLPLMLAGCGVTGSNGSSTAPTGPLSASCQQTHDALTSIQSSAGKMSNATWNDTVSSLSGQWAALGQQIVSAGAPSSDKVSSAYTDLSGTWGGCRTQ